QHSIAAGGQGAMKVAGEHGLDAAAVEEIEESVARLGFDVPIIAGFVRRFGEWGIVHEDQPGHGGGMGQLFFQEAPHGFLTAKAAAQNGRIEADDSKPRQFTRKERGTASHLEAGDAKWTESRFALFASNDLVANVVVPGDEPD